MKKDVHNFVGKNGKNKGYSQGVNFSKNIFFYPQFIEQVFHRITCSYKQ
jgi:hypothetical protein